MDLTEYRNKEIEKARISDLIALIPNDCQGAALDIGARDGWFSIFLAEKFSKVTVLDLEKPSIDHPAVECLKGDAKKLDFTDASYDLVSCAEVLEHIPADILPKVCSELERVTKQYILIGVPYKQDIRVGRTKCYTCGQRNPPWGHVNSFDEHRLKQLFSSCDVKKTSFVGENKEYTNRIAVLLLDFAGNPFGTYCQEEVCVHCGAKLKQPPKRNILQRIATRLAFYTNNIQRFFYSPHPNWIHILFEKRKA